MTRSNNATRKAREVREKNDALDSIKENIDELKRVQKETAARMKDLQATKAVISGRQTSSSRSGKAESSSSGRVTTSTKQSRAKESAKVSQKQKGKPLTLTGSSYLN